MERIGDSTVTIVTAVRPSGDVVDEWVYGDAAGVRLVEGAYDDPQRRVQEIQVVDEAHLSARSIYRRSGGE